MFSFNTGRSPSSSKLCHLNNLLPSSIPGTSHTQSKAERSKTKPRPQQTLQKPTQSQDKRSGDLSSPQKNTSTPAETAPEQSDLGSLSLTQQASGGLLLQETPPKAPKPPQEAGSRYAASGYAVPVTSGQARALTYSQCKSPNLLLATSHKSTATFPRPVASGRSAASPRAASPRDAPFSSGGWFTNSPCPGTPRDAHPLLQKPLGISIPA